VANIIETIHVVYIIAYRHKEEHAPFSALLDSLR